MIIINQDKDTIVNFDNTVKIILNDAYDDKPGQIINAADINGRIYTLAFYKSEKRAKEVLADLSTVIANKTNLKEEYFVMPKK